MALSEGVEITIRGQGSEYIIPVEQCVTPADIKQFFPRATGVWYENQDGKKVGLVVQEGKYKTPKGGWDPGRIYNIVQDKKDVPEKEQRVEKFEEPDKNTERLNMLLAKIKGQKKDSSGQKSATSTKRPSDGSKVLTMVLLDGKETFRSGKSVTHSFSGRESFLDVVKIARESFDNIPASAIKLGIMNSETLTSFDGNTLSEFMKENHIFPSKHKLYLVPDTDEPSEPQRKRCKQDKATQGVLSLGAINWSDLQISTTELGRGGYASVYSCKWRDIDAAIKIIKLSNTDTVTRAAEIIKTEVLLQSQLNHPNILPLFGFSTTGKKIGLVTERLDHTLHDLIFPDRGNCTLTNKKKHFISINMLNGLVYLHSKNIVHGDIKLSNILLDTRLNTVKICDFGLSRVKETAEQTVTASQISGTLMLMAPECLVQHNKASKASDVWSTAATICEIFSQTLLWRPGDRRSIIQNMKAKIKPIGLEDLSKVNRNVCGAITPAFNYEIKERPEAHVLLSRIQVIKF